MRAILIVAAAPAVLTTTAQAQVDHVRENVTAPACVTPFHLHEAEALIAAGRPRTSTFWTCTTPSWCNSAGSQNAISGTNEHA